MKIPEIILAKKKVIAISASAGLVIGIITLILFLNPKKEEPLPSQPTEIVLQVKDPDNVLTGAVIKLDPFVLNLKDNSGILRVKISLVFYEFELPATMKNLIPTYRDRIITLATSYSANELLKPRRRAAFKEKLIAALNTDRTDEEKITDIYFEEFNIRET